MALVPFEADEDPNDMGAQEINDIECEIDDVVELHEVVINDSLVESSQPQEST